MDMEVGEDGRNEDSREVLSSVSDCTRDDRQTDLAQVARCFEESEGGGSCNSGSRSPLVTYKDTSTWTAEDGMPSPIETSPVSSPILSHSNFVFPTDIEPPSAVVLSSSGKPCKTRTHSSGCHSGLSHSHSQGRHHHHHSHQHRQHRRQQKIINPQQLSECFTVSSQLMSREARLYENVPTTASGLENLGILLSEYHPSNSSSSGQLLSHSSNNSNETASTSNNSGKNSSSANLNNELLSVTDLLGVGPPSRTSWADSGRESLSFDGENNNSNGSSKNLLLYPPPPPIPLSVGPNHSNFGNMSSLHHHNCSSPLHMSSNGNNIIQNSGAGSSRKSRRDRLVRQKQAIEETFHPIDKMGTNGTGMSQYLAVPSPRKGVISGGMIASNLANAAASPINLQRHPNSAQMLLQENKKSHPLIPCESPYILTATNEWTHGGKMGRNKSPQRMGGASGGACGNGGHSVAARLAKSSGKYHQSFDYGELPSHQMFPKRHLLAQGQRHFSHQLAATHTSNNGSSHNVGQDNNPGSSGPQQCSGYVAGASGHLAPHQHRSFPAGLFR
ncbi:unnamed protein product [Allacma fusca]|uniref:Uncharacterized protein n=1 Tax=Allacma fusca TaxID=39272 RepID=A0A8J2K8F1_9HEXA|nr:unnamed protein product [Allacma fusca]